MSPGLLLRFPGLILCFKINSLKKCSCDLETPAGARTIHKVMHQKARVCIVMPGGGGVQGEACGKVCKVTPGEKACRVRSGARACRMHSGDSGVQESVLQFFYFFSFQCTYLSKMQIIKIQNQDEIQNKRIERIFWIDCYYALPM